MEYDQILMTLEEAENTVAALRQLIEAQKAKKNDSSVGGGSGARLSVPPGQGVFSKEQLYYTKYMDLSTITLFEQRGEEVFRIPDSVGLYFIVPGAPVRTAARSAVLRIVRLSEEYKDESHPPAFVQVGDWIYPLMPGSMAFRSEHKYYLFPDLNSTTPGSSIGVILPKTCDQNDRLKFEMLLLGFLNMPEFPPQPPESFGKSTELIMAARTSVSLVRTVSGVYSQRNSGGSRNQSGGGSSNGGYGGSYGKRIGTGIKAGGELLSRGLELGAKGTADVVNTGALCLKSMLTREEQDREIPGLVVDGIVYARDVTGRVVDLSSTIVNTLRTMTSNLASLTACWIKSASVPVVQKCIDITGLSQETVDEVATEVRNIGEGLVSGVSVAYAGLEVAAKILAETLNNNTVEIVSHCYGPSAATILVGAGQVFGNVTMTGLNTANVVNVQNQVTRTAKKAGLALAFEECSS